MKQISCIALAFLMLMAGAVPLCAEGSADYSVGISQKLGRGLLNVLSSPLEIPCGIRDEVAERGGGGTVTGLFRGITLMARRILVGVTEVGTFMIPMEETLPPACAKKPAAAIQQ